MILREIPGLALSLTRAAVRIITVFSKAGASRPLPAHTCTAFTITITPRCRFWSFLQCPTGVEGSPTLAHRGEQGQFTQRWTVLHKGTNYAFPRTRRISGQNDLERCGNLLLLPALCSSALTTVRDLKRTYKLVRSSSVFSPGRCQATNLTIS